MPSNGTKILESNQYQKSDKTFVIHADFECLIEKTDGCKINPENSSATKVSKHIRSGFSRTTISSFKSIENKHDVCRGKDFLKKFCEYLKEHAINKINFKKKKDEVIKYS